MNRRVLFVDDEPNVLEGIKRLTRKRFDVSTSLSPVQHCSCLVRNLTLP